MKYQRIVTKNKRIMYFVDGKMAKIAVIPEDVLHRLETEELVETETNEESVPTINTKKCLFDDEPATRHKFINGVTVGLCNEDYQTKTSGKIVQKINEFKAK